MFATILILAAPLVGQAAVPAKTDERLDFMTAVAGSFHFTRDGDRPEPLRLRPEPSFRMGKQPADGILEGAIFFWLGDVGRPEAAAQIFQIKHAGAPNGLWVYEFISLSSGTFEGEQGTRKSWSPRTPGVEFRPVPGATTPVESAPQRARQMKALAQEFHASDYFNDKSWVELRLLPTPVARYGRAGSEVFDGALFAFVTGTDPEAFLFLEARRGKDGPAWHYAFAPMTCYELKGLHLGKPVWEIPYRRPEQANDLSKPYYITDENK